MDNSDMKKQNEPEVIEIDAKLDEAHVIESMCPGCYENGETRMLLTDIPFFRSVIITSFSCPHCQLRNSEIQNSGQLAEFGSDLQLTVTCKEDLERDIVRGGWATTYIPELELTIPCTKKGHMSTLEGFLTSFRDDLLMGQPVRRATTPEYADQIEEFLRKLNKYITVEEDILPYTFRLVDPSGHSFIQNLNAPAPDPNLKNEKFSRTKDQLIAMGYSPENTDAAQNPKEKTKEEMDEETKARFEKIKQEHFGDIQSTIGKNAVYTKEDTEKMIEKMNETNKKVISAHKMDFSKPLDTNNVQEGSMEFDVQCHNCTNMGCVRMCTCTIPYFKEIIIMAFTCESCGARSTEVKVGGGISDQATKYEIKVENVDDMDRDVFKSETAEIQIPEIGVTVVSGSLGGVYSTVEGLIEKMLSTLRDENPFVGDSAEVNQRSNFQKFLDKLQDLKDGKILPYTIILDDPMSNCFIQNPNHPQPDPNVTVTVYDRTFEQNEDLGINDMKV